MSGMVVHHKLFQIGEGSDLQLWSPAARICCRKFSCFLARTVQSHCRYTKAFYHTKSIVEKDKLMQSSFPPTPETGDGHMPPPALRAEANLGIFYTPHILAELLGTSKALCRSVLPSPFTGST